MNADVSIGLPQLIDSENYAHLTHEIHIKASSSFNSESCPLSSDIDSAVPTDCFTESGTLASSSTVNDFSSGGSLQDGFYLIVL